MVSARCARRGRVFRRLPILRVERCACPDSLASAPARARFFSRIGRTAEAMVSAWPDPTRFHHQHHYLRDLILDYWCVVQQIARHPPLQARLVPGVRVRHTRARSVPGVRQAYLNVWATPRSRPAGPSASRGGRTSHAARRCARRCAPRSSPAAPAAGSRAGVRCGSRRNTTTRS